MVNFNFANEFDKKNTKSQGKNLVVAIQLILVLLKVMILMTFVTGVMVLPTKKISKNIGETISGILI